MKLKTLAMPNWCYNSVKFSGKPEQMQLLNELITAMMQKQIESDGDGQFPDFIPYQDGFLFEIKWENGILYYDTKRIPNAQIMVVIADHFNLRFAYRYCEFNCGIFGLDIYRDGRLSTVPLLNSEWLDDEANEEQEQLITDLTALLEVE